MNLILYKDRQFYGMREVPESGEEVFTYWKKDSKEYDHHEFMKLMENNVKSFYELKKKQI